MYHFTMTTVKVAVLLALLTVINSAIAQDATARVTVVQERLGEEGRHSPQQSCDIRLRFLQNRLDECNVAAEKARRTSTKLLATCNSRLYEAQEKISDDQRKIEELRAINLKLKRRLDETEANLQNKSQQVDQLNNKLKLCGTELNTTKIENQELNENVTKLQLIEEELKEKLLKQTMNQDMLEQILITTSIQSTHLQDLTSQLEQDFSTLNTNIEKLANSSLQEINKHYVDFDQKAENLFGEILLIKSKVDSGFATSAEVRDVQYNSLNSSQQQLLQLVEATREKATLAAGGRVILADNIYYFSIRRTKITSQNTPICKEIKTNLIFLKLVAEICRMNWYDARSFCTSQGLHLVTIESAAENQLIWEQMLKLGMIDTWLGGSDEVQEGTWRWIINGQPWSRNDYINWQPGQPEKGTMENCLYLWNGDGKWHDFGCNKLVPFICKL